MIYIADTSAIIDAKYLYPPENFSPFWEKLHEMNKNNQFIILKKVKKELSKGDDYLSSTFLHDKIITEDEEERPVKCVMNIVKILESKHYTVFSKWLHTADPFVIGYALYIQKTTFHDVFLLHSEVERGRKIKIPMVCKLFKIPNGKMNKLIIMEKFKFSLE